MKKILSILFVTIVLTFVNNAQTKTNKNITIHNSAVNYENPKMNFINERIFTTSIIISEIALLLGILFYWKKTYTESKIDNKTIFKKNIKALRNERIKYFENEKLSAIRKTLKTKIKKKIIDGKFITAKAKQMKISKGEIFLAQRLKQLQTKL